MQHLCIGVIPVGFCGLIEMPNVVHMTTSEAYEPVVSSVAAAGNRCGLYGRSVNSEVMSILVHGKNHVAASAMYVVGGASGKDESTGVYKGKVCQGDHRGRQDITCRTLSWMALYKCRGDGKPRWGWCRTARTSSQTIW